MKVLVNGRVFWELLVGGQIFLELIVVWELLVGREDLLGSRSELAGEKSLLN